MQRLAEIGLKRERRFGCLPCLFAQRFFLPSKSGIE
jgi:hypothetical protein